jgi:hypothetical protein
MLSELDFTAWAQRMKLSDEALSVVGEVRRANPARRVGSGGSSIAGRYPSRKMGVTIQFESHRVELPTVYELEHDEEVLEYYDQALSIKLNYCSADGKRLGVSHTPDFFVVRVNRAGWEECKTEEELIRLSEHNANRYRRDERGWTCPPGREYAERFGLYYRVRSSAQINWRFRRNIQFLEDYLRTTPELCSLHREWVVAQVAARPGCSLEDLFRVTDGEVGWDEVYCLIATGDLFVDLHSALLPEPPRVRVWLEKSLRSEGGQIASLPCPGPDVEVSASQIQQRLLASEADLAEATRRFHIAWKALRGEPREPLPGRTLRRWIAAYRAAQNEQGSGYLGLLPKPNRGNLMEKLSEEAESLMSAQLNRRSMDLHFERYRADSAEDRQVFRSVLLTFQRQLPFPDAETDLTAMWEFLYERSIGCVGILKEWLMRACVRAIKHGGASLSPEHLERTALSISQCEKVLAESREGETRLNDHADARAQLRTQLGIEPQPGGSVRPDLGRTPLALNRKRGRPGKRAPSRDPITQEVAAAYA